MLHESTDDINASSAAFDVEQQLDGLEGRVGMLQRQVAQLQRLASMGTMSAMLAHEFNNALTPIIAYCQYALDHGDAELMRTAAEKTLRNARHLAVLCGRVLGMAAEDSLAPKETAVLPLVEDAVACLGRDLGKDRIELCVDIPADLKVRAVAGALQQVLFNLLINGRQAMADQAGRLRISGRRADDGKVAIEVADTGPGIKPVHLDKVFEPFFTTRRHGARLDRCGIGLGLSICRQLMEEQDGTIAVASRPGEGATFTLTLPVAG